MNKYHVTYYYLATGMEGHVDTRDYGLVYAESDQEAIDIVGWRTNQYESNKSKRNWGLSAKLISTGLKEPINDVYLKMNQQTKIIDSTAQFIVGSVDSDGRFSISEFPYLHKDSLSARNECARLACITPGKLYIFLRIVGGELIPTTEKISF